MNQFNWSAYSRWQEPLGGHELDNCPTCHDSGLHDEQIEKWADKLDCSGCDDKLDFAIKRKEYCVTCHAWFCDQTHQEETNGKS